MLIIEGSDNCGKTTAAKRIEELCILSDPFSNVSYQHSSRPDEATFDFYHQYKPMIDPNFIRDRFHIGGIVYHKNKIDTFKLSWIEKWLEEIGSLVVIMYCSNEDVYESWLNNGRQQMFSVKQLMEYNRAFVSIVHRFHFLKPRWDYAWDICPNKEICFPSDDVLYIWIKDWFERKLKCLKKY